MPITLNGDTGITTPGLTNTGSTTLVSLTTTGNTILGDQSTDTLNVANGNLVLNSSGNLGIGTASPASALYVKRTSGNSGIYTDYNGTNVGRIEAASNGNLYIGITTGSGDLSIGNTANATALNLSSSGNFGIGTASPSQKLHVENNANSSTWVKVANTNSGSGAAAGVLFTNDGGDLGAISLLSSANSPASSLFLRSLSTNPLVFGTNNTERARIDSSGNLGIGTTSISYRLEAASGAGVYWNGSNGWTGGIPTAVVAKNTATGGYDPVFIGQMTDSAGNSKNSFAIGTVGTNSWTAGNNASQVASLYIAVRNDSGGISERARIDSSGRFGIGTTSPATNLHIGSGTGNNLGVLLSRGVTTNFYEAYDGTKTFIGGVDNTNAFAKVGTLSAHDLAIVTGNGAKIYCVDSTGNVGIGNSAPPMILSASTAGAVISGTATIGTNMRGIQVYNTNSATTNNAVGIWFPTGPHQAGIASFRADAAAGWDTTLAFYTHGAATSQLNDCFERMRITGEGNLLVGTTSEMFSARIVVGCASGSESIAFGISSNVTRASGTKYGFSLYRDNTNETNAVTFVENASSGNNAASYVVRTNAATGGSTVTSVSGGVALVQGATSWSSYSDLRLKHDVVPVTNAIESILKIDPIFFKWNDRPEDQQRSIGVSAQSVEKVFPELIDRSGIYDVEGGAMQVRYTELIPVLLAAIKELKSELDSVKTELAALKGN